MKKNYIYLVTGNTGEWDDHHWWIVCAHTTRKSANKHMREAQKFAHITFALNTNYDHNITKSPHDPHFHMDCNGTKYKVERTPLV